MVDIYEVVSVPHPSLKTKSQPVEAVDDQIRAQMDKMAATMYADKGIGLAANQVDILNRVLVVDVNPDTWHYGEEEEDGIIRVVSTYKTGQREEEEKEAPSHLIKMANPEIIERSAQNSVFPEGCLSVPGHYADVVRSAHIKVKYLDYDGKEQVLEAEGLLSHCLQHEIDHLDGVLFVDHISNLKRNMILKKLKKLQKDQIAL
ncbi:MAG: peptide deformylase [Rhodospirillales bacterium]|nr:peptide deformylase [Alphaproteobacteria bacterium]USO03907.1 MAG: peptide deformylase [Rhodospirillales bacterium]